MPNNSGSLSLIGCGFCHKLGGKLQIIPNSQEQNINQGCSSLPLAFPSYYLNILGQRGEVEMSLTPYILCLSCPSLSHNPSVKQYFIPSLGQQVSWIHRQMGVFIYLYGRNSDTLIQVLSVWFSICLKCEKTVSSSTKSVVAKFLQNSVFNGRN